MYMYEYTFRNPQTIVLPRPDAAHKLTGGEHGNVGALRPETKRRFSHIDTLIGKRLNSKMPTFQDSPKTVSYTNGVRSFAKPCIAILVVNTMKVGGVKTFATGVKTFAAHNLT